MNPNIHGRGLACALIALSVIHLPARDADAAGFAIRENSTSGLGNAFAGVPTNTNDISSIANNPALLGAFDGINFSSSLSYIVPNARFKNGQASTLAPISAPIGTTSTFDGNDDISRDALVGASYFSLSLTDELKAGFAVTAPFGLVTDNPDGWVGRYHALKSQVLTFDLNPMLAYRVTDWLSIGGGFRAVYAEAEVGQAIDFGTILFSATGGALGTPTQQDGRAEVHFSDWGFGGNAGIMFEPGKLYAPLDGLRFGVGYRSRIALEGKGEAHFQDDNSGAVATLRSPAVANDQTLFTDTDVTSSLDLPESVTFGLHYDLNDQWAFMTQAEWTKWSEFEELVIEFDNPSQSDSVTEEDWNDSWFFAVGTTYRPDWVEGLSLRLGFAYDQSPIPERTRTPRVPGEDRFWIASGINYQPYSWASVDFGYTHIFVPDADIDLSANDEGSTFRGNLSGKYEANIDIFSLQANLTF